MFFLEVDSKGKKIHKGPFNNIDWKNTWIYIKFLRLFNGVTLRFSEPFHVMSNCFFHELVSIQTQISKLSKNKDFLTNEMTSNMKWSVSVRFSYFILKTENYIVFWVFLDFLMGFFGSVFFVWFGLFLNLISSIRFDFFISDLWNRTKF